MDSADAIFLMFACSYLSLCIVPLFDTSSVQKRCFRKVRYRFAEHLQLKKLREANDDQVEGSGPSWRLLPLAFEFIMFIQTLSHLYEGRFFIAANVIVVSSILGLAAARGSYKTMIWSGRMAFLQHFTVFYMTHKYKSLNNDLMVRGVFARSLGALCFHDRVDETFIQLIAFSWLFSLNRPSGDPMVMLPMRVWLLLVFPINILGIREWVANSTILLGRSPVKLSLQLFAAVSLPVMVLFLAPLSMNVNQPVQGKFVIVLCSVNALWGLFNYHFAEEIDNALMLSTFAETSKASALGTDFSGMPSTLETEIMVRTTSLAFAIGLTLLAAVCTMSSIAIWANASLSIVYLLCLLAVAGITSGTLNLEHIKKSPTITRQIFSVQVALLLVMTAQRRFLREDSLNDLERCAILSLIASRLVLTVDYQRMFSGLQIEASLFFAVTCFAVSSDADLIRLVVAGSVTCTLISAFVVMARERTWQIIRRERASHAFLSHALKQKYAGVGSAIEESLGHLKDLGDVAAITLTLEELRRECRRGHDACHAVNVLGNARSQRYTGGPVATSVKCIRNEIDNWCAKGIIDSSKVKFGHGILSRSGRTDVQVHWEVLKAFFINFVCRQCVVVVDCDSKEVSIRVLSKRGLSQDDVLIIACIAQTLGSSSSTHHGFNIPLVTTKAQVDDVDSFLLPKNLRFAVLDDNALVRMSLKRILEHKLDAHPASFYRGINEEECLRFPSEVKAEDPDIVLLDEHLVDDIRGSEVARSIRKLGYGGCILLHSATTISADRPLDACFDGMVEKTSSKDDFVDSITRCWQGFSARRISRRSRSNSLSFSSSSITN